MKQAGVLYAAGGIVRLFKWADYPTDWDPQTDQRLPVWEVLHQLIRVFNTMAKLVRERVLAPSRRKAKPPANLLTGSTRFANAQVGRKMPAPTTRLITSWSAHRIRCREAPVADSKAHCLMIKGRQTMKPWREITVPHRDVLEGTFQQSEFAADITAVHTGKATREYQDAVAFFDRTFITEGMRLLLTQVAQRLAGKGGEPVIQLQTAFGGGKTHTMLAVYHLATRKCALSELAGIPALIDQAGLMDVPQARVAVLDGTAHAPGQPWKHGKQTIKTLWGELAWQLGGSEGFALVKEADATGTSPGKDVLRDLLAAYAPCVVLIDELVAYVRQFPEGQTLSGGSYDSNLSFVQALTEAAKLVPNAIVLASLPESEVEAGSQRGVAALRALEKIFGRVQALWKPVATEEAFEIVRRRLFEPVRDAQSARRGVPRICRCLHRRGSQTSSRDAGRSLLRPAHAGLPDPPRGLRPAL